MKDIVGDEDVLEIKVTEPAVGIRTPEELISVTFGQNSTYTIASRYSYNKDEYIWNVTSEGGIIILSGDSVTDDTTGDTETDDIRRNTVRIIGKSDVVNDFPIPDNNSDFISIFSSPNLDSYTLLDSVGELWILETREK